jgi:voltage-gated potassium channel
MIRQIDQKKLKEQLYTIIFGTDTFWGKTFDVALIVCIILSVLITIFESSIDDAILSVADLMHSHEGNVKELTHKGLIVLEYVFNIFFTLEYIVRIYCSPKPKRYILSFFGIVDLLSILPFYLAFIFSGARFLLIIRSFRLIRVFRVFKLFNFLDEGNLLLLSLQRSFSKIFVFFFFVLILNICIGTLMYVIEGKQPDTPFTNIPNGIYWSIVTMSTVGYGDITPSTPLGKFLSAAVMLLGYTIIAVPTGIVSATMIKENERRKRYVCPHCGYRKHSTEARYCSHCGHPIVWGQLEKKKS